MTYRNRAKRTVLTVFIGSPSDLTEERKATREVIDSLNQHLARNLGITIELRGWEDTLPGFSRPQDKINEDVREADLFIGIVWCRWGTPTGQHSSGFEEEYVLAKEQRSKDQLEDIWLFFKDVPADMLRDPGEQLRKVLQFKEGVTSEREVLYDSFAYTEDWSKKLVNYLSNYLTQDLRSEESKQEAGVEPSSNEAIVENVPENSVEQSMSVILSALKQGTFDEVSLFQAVRVHMASSSLLYLKQRDSQPMGTHESNLVYRLRTEIRLTRIERIYVLRSLVADRDDLRAGWFWIDETSDSVAEFLLAFASFDHSHETRWKALELVEHIEAELDLTRVEGLIGEENKLVAASALRVLIQRTPSDLGKFKELSKDPSWEISTLAWLEVLRTLAQSDATQAVKWVLDGAPLRTPDYIEVLNPLWLGADTDIVKALLKAERAAVRRKAFDVVKASLARSEIEPLTMDPDPQMKAAAYLELVCRGIEVDAEELEEALKEPQQTSSSLAMHPSNDGGIVPSYRLEDVLLQIYKKLPYETFERMADWASTKAPIKYEALATEHFERFGEMVREDFRQDFSRIRELFYSGLRQVHGRAAEPAIKDFKKLESFVAALFRTRALKVLSKHPNQSDAELARNYLKGKREDHDRQGTIAAFRILKEYGTAEDSELIQRSMSDWDPALKSEAAESLLELPDSDRIDTLRYLLDTEKIEAIRVALRWLLVAENRQLIEEVKELLYDEKNDVRLIALSYLANAFSYDELESVLENYPNNNRYYYYNVICWLDRILYTPSGLREMFSDRLKENLR